MAVVQSKRGWDALLDGEPRRKLEREAFPPFLKRQRWFAGKARSISSVRLLDVSLAGEIPEPNRLAIVEVGYEGGRVETYFLPIGVASGAEAERIERESPGRVIGRIDPIGVVFDSLSDPAVCSSLLDAIGENRSFRASAGTIRAFSTSAFPEARGPLAKPLSVAGGSFEQSNSAVVFGDRLILKVFRRLEPGINPDFEIGRFFAEKTRFDRVPRTAGALLYDTGDAEPLMLGILQGLVKNEGTGWDHALHDLKTYFEEASRRVGPVEGDESEGRPVIELARLEAPEGAKRAIGPYLQAAATLGRRTAEMHLALASDATEPAFRPEKITPEDLEHLADEVREQVAVALKSLQANLAKLPEATAAEGREVLAGSSALLEATVALVALKLDATKIRCHGDYHLGQVLRTGDDFVILDFEGEPAKSLPQRLAKMTPLKDVVGMIRSFDYAAFAALFAFAGDRAGVFDRLVPWAKSWRTWTSATFLKEYLATAAGASFLPDDPEQVGTLLDALMLDKALYELLYELNNRPDWVRIPLQGITALLDPRAEKSQANPPSSDAPGLSPSALGDVDLYLLGEGTHYRSYEKLGAHLTVRGGNSGVSFAVWAPNAREVSVIGDFNGWDPEAHPMQRREGSGYWERFIPGVGAGITYKYQIHSQVADYRVAKADPFAFAAEPRPKTASVVADLAAYRWGDEAWLASRRGTNSLGAPISIYEAHLGSWMRSEDGTWLTYAEIAPKLADHLHGLGFTHVELMPIAEHPFDGSWGYQVTGYFAPTSRFGSPADFMAFVDYLHQRGIGVILDWVPAHFPNDEHALGYFDGTHLYEHPDPKQGFHPDWNTFIFDFGRPEVANFLISNALFWLDKYHIDGLRVDAVASMLYRDYSRKPGEWVPNQYGGRENLEAITLLRRVNERVHAEFPGVLTIAEESTAWPMVSRPTDVGGLGFDLKWDLGWMHDTLAYLEMDPIHRKHHHGMLTFRGVYAFSENFILPLSHDEVVYGKGSLLKKMAGDRWQKFANLRLLLGYQYVQPGKKLLFMGDEFGQWEEWGHDGALDWHILGDPAHAGLMRWVRDLNTLYRGSPALHELDCHPDGFLWIDADDSERSVLSFLRKGHSKDELILIVANFTPIPRTNYRVGVPRPGQWAEILNGDATIYGGSGQGNIGGAETSPIRAHGRNQSLNLTLPPLALIALRSPGR